jgi:peptide/nickel transport system substrate-binding protein
MIRKILPFLLALLILSSCGVGGKKEEGPIIRPAKGGVFYGGIFKINEVEDFKNLFEYSILDKHDALIIDQTSKHIFKLNWDTALIFNQL